MEQSPLGNERRFLRARLLAYLAWTGDATGWSSNMTGTLLRWHYLMARELQDEIVSYAQSLGLTIEEDASMVDF